MRLLLVVALASCGSSHDTKLANTAPPPAARPDAGTLTLASDDEFIANGREIVRRLVAIFTADGQDCDKLAADLTKLSEDPIWPASTRYEDAHPDVRDRYAAEQAQMGEQFGAVAGPAVSACALNEAFGAALAKMR